jgi:hypothetical protein
MMLGSHNTRNKLSCKISRNYIVMHAILSLNTIALYREYMAFLPWDIARPDGPLDKPKIEETPPDKEYWVNQARKCFGAAKDFADLLRAAKSANALVDSPIVGWATYIVAWCSEWPEVCSFPFRKANRLQLYIVLSSRIWIPIMH